MPIRASLTPATEHDAAMPIRASKARSIAAAKEVDRAVGGTVKSMHNFWLKWAEIAITHEGEAWSARRRAEQADRADGKAFDDEFTAALVAVTSAAFALEALGNHTAEFLGVAIPDSVREEWKKRKMPAAVRILALLTTAFDFGDHDESWRANVRTLFDLRNKVVHFNPEWLDVVPHPTGKSNVAPELAIYTAEEATRSVKLAVDIIVESLKSPSGDQPRVRIGQLRRGT
jgi:hypothetical protein